MQTYASLHNHTCFSTLDSLCKPEPLVQRAKELGMSAISCTDHGILTAVPEFVQACTKAGIKPIIGMEAYVCPDRRRHEKFKTAVGRLSAAGYHLTLLARNIEGYRNLIRLTNIGHTEGMSFRPKVDAETLAKYSAGLICLTGCVSSELNDFALAGAQERAHKLLGWFTEVYGAGNVFIEVMENGMKADLQRKSNAVLLELARQFGLPVVPTNDTHYLLPEHQRFHNLMFQANAHEEEAAAEARGKKARTNKMTGYDGIYHLKTPDEMYRVFGDLARNTLILADQIEAFDIFSKEVRLPQRVKDPQAMLTMLAQSGLANRGLSDRPEYRARLQHELDVIGKLGFANYFLTTHEIIGILRSINCSMGWGRGSGGSSLACYCLEITDVDPVRYGLLFERFISADRPDWPDIDIDIPRSRRDEIIEQVIARFGADRVAHISTVQTFRPKALLRDVCRISEISQKTADRWSSLVPWDAKDWKDLSESDGFEALEKELKQSQPGQLALEAMQEVLGVQRHDGVHASGIVISDIPVVDFLPVRSVKVGDKRRLATQYTMNYLAPFGAFKFDVLGLKTLDVIHTTAKDVGVDLRTIPVEDPKPYELVAEGRVDGMFQLDAAPGCADLCRQVRPANMMDLMTILAVNRPGVMNSEQYGIYLQRRKGLEAVQYVHPDLRPFLQDHYGVPIYQEDLMVMAMIVAGYTPVEAYGLMKGVGKKDMTIIRKHLETFSGRARALGLVDALQLQQIVEQIEAAGRYSFNRAHSCSYAHVTYACAWLSCYHPLHFFKHLIAFADDKEERSKYLSAAMNRGIKIVAPNVNTSEALTTVDGDALRLGLTSIHGIGSMTVKDIMAARPFRHASEVLSAVNRSVYSALWAAKALEGIQGLDEHPPAAHLGESQVLGVSLGQLADEYRDVMRLVSAVPSHSVGDEPQSIVVQVDEVRPQKIKKEGKNEGKMMAFLELVDVFGPKIKAVMFPEAYAGCKPQEKGVYQAIVIKSARGGLIVKQLVPAEDIRLANSVRRDT